MAGDQNTDIFGLDNSLGGAWSIDGAVLSLGQYENGLVATSVNMTYTRAAQKFSPLNQTAKYLVTGDANGTLQLGFIVGPSKTIKAFLKDFSDPCQAVKGKNVITVSPVAKNFKLCPGQDYSRVAFTAHGCLLTTIGLTVQQLGGGMAILNANTTLTFTWLSIDASQDND